MADKRLKRVRAVLSRKGDMVLGGAKFAHLKINHLDFGGKEEETPCSVEKEPLLRKLDELEKGGKTDKGDIATARAEIEAHFQVR